MAKRRLQQMDVSIEGTKKKGSYFVDMNPANVKPGYQRTSECARGPRVACYNIGKNGKPASLAAWVPAERVGLEVSI